MLLPPPATDGEHHPERTVDSELAVGELRIIAPNLPLHSSEKTGIEGEDDDYAGPSSLQYDDLHDGGRGE